MAPPLAAGSGDVGWPVGAALAEALRLPGMGPQPPLLLRLAARLLPESWVPSSAAATASVSAVAQAPAGGGGLGSDGGALLGNSGGGGMKELGDAASGSAASGGSGSEFGPDDDDGDATAWREGSLGLGLGLGLTLAWAAFLVMSGAWVCLYTVARAWWARPVGAGSAAGLGRGGAGAGGAGPGGPLGYVPAALLAALGLQSAPSRIGGRRLLPSRA